MEIAAAAFGVAGQVGAVCLILLGVVWLVNPPAARKRLAVDALRLPAYMGGALGFLVSAELVCQCVASPFGEFGLYAHLPLVWALDGLARWRPAVANNWVGCAAFLLYWYLIAHARLWAVRRAQIVRLEIPRAGDE